MLSYTPNVFWRRSCEAPKALGRYFVHSGPVWAGPVWQLLLVWCLGAGICGSGVCRAGDAHRGVYAALPVLPPLSWHDVFLRQKDVLPALRQRCARGQKRLTAPSFSAMLDASNMRKRGYHETWPVPDAGHGVQNGKSCDDAPLCARCNCGRL